MADALHRDQSPNPKFPDNREINREFLILGPLSPILALNRRVNSDGYNKIPYAMEQGIFLAEQGIFLREQGSSAKQQGIGIGDQFQNGRKHPGAGMRRHAGNGSGGLRLSLDQGGGHIVANFKRAETARLGTASARPIAT